MSQPQPPEFSRPISLERIERQHKTLKIEATADECAALAKRFGLVDIEFLKAECEFWRGRDEVFFVKGTITSKLTQECVVTFEPVPAELQEEFSEKLSAPGYIPDEEDEEDLEQLTTAELDLGEIVAQYFALSLNQYPRAAIVE